MGFLSSVSDKVQNIFAEEVIDPRGLIAKHNAAELSAFLPYRYYDEESELFVNDDGYGFCIEFVPLIGGDQQTLDVLSGVLSLQVPDEVSVQIMLNSSPKVGRILEYWEEARANAPQAYREAARHRVRHFGSGAWDSLAKSTRMMLRYHRCIISVSKKSVKGEEHKVIEELREYKEQMESAFGQASAGAFELKPQDLIPLVSDILNPTTNIQPGRRIYSKTQKINKQVVSPDTTYTVYRDRISTVAVQMADPMVGEDIINDNYRETEMEMRCLETRYFPRYLAFGSMGAILGDFFTREIRYGSPVISVLNVFYPKAEPAKNKAETAFMRSKQVAEGPMGRYMPSMQNKARDWDDAQKKIVDGGRPVEVGMFTMVTARKGECHKSERNARNVFSSGRFETRRTDMVHLPTLLMMMPMSCAAPIGYDARTKGRYQTQISTMIPVAAPIFGEFMGTPQPVMMLVGRLGHPFWWSNFASMGEGNFNGTFIGGSGSGKSFAINELVMSHCGTGGHAIIVDDGYSFEVPCRLVGGRHYEFNMKSNFCLNPFDMIEDRDVIDPDLDYDDYLNERFETAKAVFSQMAIGERIPTREESGVIMEAISAAWREGGRGAGANEVAAFLKGMKKDLSTANPAAMAQAMSPYTGDGNYARIFNGKNTLDLSSHMTVFELSPLEHNKELRSIIVSALFSLIDMKVTKNRNRMDLVVLDEAWKVLGNETLSATLEGWARRLRKYGAGLILGTQSLQELKENKSARAVFENSEWTVILKSKASALQPMIEMGVFTDDYALRCAKDLKVSKGEYSEMLIMCDRWYAVGRLNVDPFTAALYSTDAQDVGLIRDLQNNGHSLQEAVMELASRK